MRAPDRYPSHQSVESPPRPAPYPVTPTVYPVDDHVKEKLLGPDGKPLSEGTKRKHPIGFHKGQS